MNTCLSNKSKLQIVRCEKSVTQCSVQIFKLKVRIRGKLTHNLNTHQIKLQNLNIKPNYTTMQVSMHLHNFYNLFSVLECEEINRTLITSSFLIAVSNLSAFVFAIAIGDVTRYGDDIIVI